MASPLQTGAGLAGAFMTRHTNGVTPMPPSRQNLTPVFAGRVRQLIPTIGYNQPTMSESVTLKGIRDGVLLTVSEALPWPSATTHLLERLHAQNDFFKGAKVALAVGLRPLTAAELGRLREQLADAGVTLWAVLSDAPATITAAQALGLLIELPSATPARRDQPEPEANPEEPREDAVMVRRTLRSGRSVRHDGHVVVLGDVNPGAEIVATGDIVVWGRLRGLAHAGAAGDAEAVICALDLAPMQLRIAQFIATAPPRKGEPKPEIARVRDGQIVAERWRSADK